MMLNKPWPINEHQKAVLKENWTGPTSLLSESSRIIPTATETAKSRKNTEQLSHVATRTDKSKTQSESDTRWMRFVIAVWRAKRQNARRIKTNTLSLFFIPLLVTTQ
jgi:hypothetical protein